ncbi:MAG: hypothetical protein LC100_06075 [Chitinophagales bacterium]|nr:hypothetical protein [Chitinophagales bacterium]
MKKSDLVSGKHVVEIREDEKRFLFLGDKCVSAGEYCEFRGISQNLLHKKYKDLDIMKIYEIEEYQDLNSILIKKKGLKLVWERKPELSEAERVILENVDKKYKWIAREGYIETKGMLGGLGLFEDRPRRINDYWSGTNYATFTFSNLFKMVKWEDEEPTLIADLLGE